MATEPALAAFAANHEKTPDVEPSTQSPMATSRIRRGENKAAAMALTFITTTQ